MVGNKGNTTVGQSKINAAEKRKSFKGNTETGQSKRNAGKRSGLIRRAKQALVVQKRWLDKILDGEKDWEIRSSRTRHRGWVFFAQSKATGQLLGRARLVDCFELSADTFEAHAHRHCVAAWNGSAMLTWDVTAGTEPPTKPERGQRHRQKPRQTEAGEVFLIRSHLTSRLR